MTTELERSCKTCMRDCALGTGYDHAPFQPRLHRVGTKTFVCWSWTDNPHETRMETETGVSAISEAKTESEAFDAHDQIIADAWDEYWRIDNCAREELAKKLKELRTGQ